MELEAVLRKGMRDVLGFGPNQWVKWVAMMDERTSADCRALNECYFFFSKCPRWPEHPNCRCYLAAISPPDITATASIRKFTEYLFAEKGKEKGKDVQYYEWGYTIEDSELLRAIYVEQAKAKYQNGDYVLGKIDHHGQRVTIIIELSDKDGKIKIVKSGWLVEPLGTIRLTTPHAGWK